MTTTRADASNAEQADAELYDERRLNVLVRFSASLRWPMTMIVCIIAAIAWGGGCPPLGVLIWLAATIAIRETRAAALVRLDRAVTQPIADRLRQVAGWTLALGLAHGSAALFMLKLDTAYDAVLTMVLISMSAGAVSTTFTVLTAFNVYVGAIALPTFVLWMAGGDALHLSIGLLVLLFMTVQIRFARQNMQLFEESYRMRLENVALLRQLSLEREQLARARDAAVQADQSKSRFLAAASHDLRQPLQSLSLNSGALTRRLLDGESRLIADEISVGIEALRQMLDALLDVSTLDAGDRSPTLQPIPLDLLIHGLGARFRPAATSKGLLLLCECPPGTVVISDVDMLQRLLSNLLDNAIKFTPSGSIRLSAAREGGQVRVTVADTGIGIAECDQARVFDDLVQLGNPHRDRNFGHGLGLGIVRRLAQLLGATCAIASAPGSGTRVTLDLPPGDASAPVLSHAARHDASPSYPSLIARRVLVLDDDANVRSAYAHALQSLGCQVCCCANLPDALTALTALPGQRPEIALVDYRLSEACNGLDAIAQLRAVQPGLAAIIVSADTSAALRERAARSGVPMLRKPVSEAMLAVVIGEALQEAGV